MDKHWVMFWMLIFICIIIIFSVEISENKIKNNQMTKKMFEEFKKVKRILEELQGIHGVIFRVENNQFQFFVSFKDFQIFNKVAQVLPDGWTMNFIKEYNLAFIYYHLTNEQMQQEEEKIMFP